VALTTWTALTTLAGEGAAVRLGEALERVEPVPGGVGVFELEDGSGLWEVGGYFEARPPAAALALLEAVFGVRFAVSEVPPTDWVAHVRRELAPVEAGRFVVHGAHDADRLPEGRVALLIEASMAFGTGHHGTTLGCLLAFDRLLEEDVRGPVLDLGCGTAVLAMAAARTLGGTVLASDVDPVAVEVARANVAANGLSGAVACLEADGVADPRIAEPAPYGLVFANILLGPLLALAPGIAALVAEDGCVVLSGLLWEQAEDAARRYASLGLVERRRDRRGDWATLTLARGPG
jgi:ribosomal protein L11 methyltransferase